MTSHIYSNCSQQRCFFCWYALLPNKARYYQSKIKCPKYRLRTIRMSTAEIIFSLPHFICIQSRTLSRFFGGTQHSTAQHSTALSCTMHCKVKVIINKDAHLSAPCSNANGKDVELWQWRRYRIDPWCVIWEHHAEQVSIQLISQRLE